MTPCATGWTRSEGITDRKGVSLLTLPWSQRGGQACPVPQRPNGARVGPHSTHQARYHPRIQTRDRRVQAPRADRHVRVRLARQLGRHRWSTIGLDGPPDLGPRQEALVRGFRSEQRGSGRGRASRRGRVLADYCSQRCYSRNRPSRRVESLMRSASHARYRTSLVRESGQNDNISCLRASPPIIGKN